MGGEILILQSASADFPQEIFIFCAQIGGYLDNGGLATHIVAIFRIKEIFSVVVSGVTTYTMLYSMKDPLSWPIGLTRNLSFTVGDRDGVYTPSLTSAVSLELKIHHVSY